MTTPQIFSNVANHPGANGDISKLLRDRQTKEHYSFEQWLSLLDHAFLSIGARRRIVQDTGADCWRHYYDDGYTVHDTMLEDLSCA